MFFEVRRTLAKKDSVIDDLRNQLTAADCRAREFEYLLDRQREEILGEIGGRR